MQSNFKLKFYGLLVSGEFEQLMALNLSTLLNLIAELMLEV